MLHKYAKKNQNKICSNQNLSSRFFGNTTTLKSKDPMSYKQTTRASYFNEQSKNFEDLIRNDTNQFNKIMESQYKHFDYSYYYVQASHQNMVFSKYNLMLGENEKSKF